jgi:hypothetical protein
VAALAWATDVEPPALQALGIVLARDPDPRVRRALANELARQATIPRTQQARELLCADVLHSVRSEVLPPPPGG